MFVNETIFIKFPPTLLWLCNKEKSQGEEAKDDFSPKELEAN